MLFLKSHIMFRCEDGGGVIASITPPLQSVPHSIERRRLQYGNNTRSLSSKTIFITLIITTFTFDLFALNWYQMTTHIIEILPMSIFPLNYLVASKPDRLQGHTHGDNLNNREGKPAYIHNSPFQTHRSPIFINKGLM